MNQIHEKKKLISNNNLNGRVSIKLTFDGENRNKSKTIESPNSNP